VSSTKQSRGYSRHPRTGVIPEGERTGKRVDQMNILHRREVDMWSENRNGVISRNPALDGPVRELIQRTTYITRCHQMRRL
jgi:hypothetical protein